MLLDDRLRVIGELRRAPAIRDAVRHAFDSRRRARGPETLTGSSIFGERPGGEQSRNGARPCAPPGPFIHLPICIAMTYRFAYPCFSDLHTVARHVAGQSPVAPERRRRNARLRTDRPRDGARGVAAPRQGGRPVPARVLRVAAAQLGDGGGRRAAGRARRPGRFIESRADLSGSSPRPPSA